MLCRVRMRSIGITTSTSTDILRNSIGASASANVADVSCVHSINAIVSAESDVANQLAVTTTSVTAIVDVSIPNVAEAVTASALHSIGVAKFAVITSKLL